MVMVDYADAAKAGYRRMIFADGQRNNGWPDFFDKRVGSVADASNVLGEFVHADGKLHMSARVRDMW
jgi:hypothetical protein